MIRSAKVILAVIAMILPTSFLEVNAHCNCYDVLTDSTVDLSEIKYKSKAEIKDLPVLQRKILENASKYVKVGGSLLYSTCTILDSENIEVINNFLKENDNFELVPIDEVNVDLDNQEKGYLKIYPNIHGMDGFFIAKLKRVR